MPTLKRSIRRQRNRRALPLGATRPVASLVPTVVDFTTPDVDITFDAPFVLRGIPAIATNTSKLPTAATRTSPLVLHLTYDTPGSVTSVTIPQNDPAVRSNTGGFVTSGTFPVT